MRRLWLLLWCCIMAGTALAEDVQYTFRPGDSLWRVCETFARDPEQCWRELAQHNGIKSPRAIPPGTLLNIPAQWLKQAPEPATLVSLAGEVTLYRNNGEIERHLEKGADIGTGDALETGAVSSARVLFADQSELLIKPGSLVIFDRYSRFRDTGMVDTSLRLERGELRTFVRPRGPSGGRFMIVTPTAVAAVRGTRFDVEVDPQEVSRNIVLKGTVAFSAEGKEQLVPAGYASTAEPGMPPSKPVALLPPVALATDVKAGKVSASWPAQADARDYWLEWYQMPDKRLLGTAAQGGDQWQHRLAPGHYQLIVRAVDANGVRGEEAIADLEVAAPAPVAQKPKHDWRGLWVFLVGSALMLSM